MSAIRCYYEVLEVDRDADADTLKKSYRKLALKWHPDKNRTEEAESRFKEINAAYEVLSDPQERAWYDDHRESILSGGDGTAGDSNTVSLTPNLWQWFRASCFSGFGDDEQGFYSVYTKAFDEIIAVENDRGIGGVHKDAPRFGTSEEDLKSVERFYAYFEAFTTSLSFGWADVYNPNEVATNRYQRRIVEKENKKARTAARREYSENVRSLARYAKKRDKRMVQIAMERQRKKEEQERARVAALEAKQQQKREAREAWFEFVKQEERRIAEMEAETGVKVFSCAAEDAENAAKSDDEEVIFRCDACSKNFKSEKQLDNHEKSKKHKEAIKKLQHRLRQEEAAIKKAMAKSLESSAKDKTDNVDKGDDVVGVVSERDEESESESESDSDDDDFGAFGRSRRQNDSEHDDSDEEEEEEEDEDGEGEKEEGTVEEGENEEGDVEQGQLENDAVEEQEEDEFEEDEESGKAVADSKSPPSAPEFSCSTCSKIFHSRNQLFKHINDTNHAAPPSSSRKKNKKNKKR